VSLTTTRPRRVLAGGLTAMLMATGAAFVTMTPAAAATEHVPAASIAPDDTSYLGWHLETGNAAQLADVWNGLRTDPAADIYALKGLVNTGAPGLPVADGAALGSLITAAVIVATGDVLLEVPYSVTDPVTPTTINAWGTLRTAAPVVSGTAPTLTTPFISSRTLGTIPANTTAPLQDFLDQLDAVSGDVRYSGYGFYATAQFPPAVVSSIAFGGDTTTFGRVIASTPVTSTVNVVESEIRPDESTYTGWHEGYANPTPAYDVTTAGLSLGNGANSQIINGLATPIVTTAPFAAFTSLSVTVVSGEAFLQVPVFFGPGNTFATLRPATGATAGTSGVALTDLWVSSRAIPATATTPAIAANDPVVLGDLLEALVAQGGSVQLLAFGVLAQASAPAVVSQVSFNGVSYSFVPQLAATGVDPASTLAAAGGALILLLAGGVLIALRRRWS
jgi:LPXTG-motif cell wall-anchored protein